METLRVPDGEMGLGDPSVIAYNEALSALQVLKVAREVGIDVRQKMTEPSYAEPMDASVPSAWEFPLDRQSHLPAFRRMLHRTWGILSREAARTPSLPPHPTDMMLHVGGPSGSGKTSLGNRLATAFGLPVVDGDALHTQDAVDCMHANGRLTDEYRLNEWLPRMESVVKGLHSRDGLPSIVICSALSESVRNEMGKLFGEHQRIYCQAPKEVLQVRLMKRVHPYIQANPQNFLDGQWNGWTDMRPHIEKDPMTLIVDTTAELPHVLAQSQDFVGKRWTP